MEQLAAETIAWHPASFADGTGRVFTRNGGIYRAIAPDAADHVRTLLANARFRALQDRGAIVSARVAPISVPGAAFVLEHPRIPFVTYAHEWIPEMLRDAALRTLEVAEEMLGEGIVLQDATPRNIVFDGTNPVFVDIGSFVLAPNDVLWAPYEQFCAMFLFPLTLAASGREDISRTLLFAYPDGIPLDVFSRALPVRGKMQHSIRYLQHRLSARVAQWLERRGLGERVRTAAERTARIADLPRARQRFFASLRREVESFSFPRVASTWGTYDADDLPHRGATQDVRKEAAIVALLQRIRPSSIADVGANAGLFASRVVHRFPGVRVVAMDADATAVDACYARARAAGTALHPAVVDVLNPSPAFGWCGREYASATERLRADVAMGLALIHHLAIVRRQGFDRALAAIEAFGGRAVIVEFVGPDDPMVIRLMRQSRFAFPWYTWDTFMRTIRTRGVVIDIATPHAVHRRLIAYAIAMK